MLLTYIGSSGLGTNAPQLLWCISSNSNLNWSNSITMTAGSGSQWTTSISQNGAQSSGQKFYYEILALDVAGNSASVTNSVTMTYTGSGLGGTALPLWANLLIIILMLFGASRLLTKRFPKERIS